MNRQRTVQRAAIAGAALSLAGVLLAQAPAPAPAPKQLVVNGRVTNAAIVQVGGRSYVDIDTLAQLTNGSVSISPTQIVLTIPNANGSVSSSTSPPATLNLSRNFASAAITTVAQMKEWTGAVATMVTYGLAADVTRAQNDHDRVESSLAQASVAASTSADREALRLLNNEFGNVENWASSVVAQRQALNGDKTMDPNALQNDPALAKISNCSRFLNSMLGSGTFSDNSTCD
ncbi:MAG: hypothetical protein WA871_10290 [Candidatus Acidiferrales bacterium]